MSSEVTKLTHMPLKTEEHDFLGEYSLENITIQFTTNLEADNVSNVTPQCSYPATTPLSTLVYQLSCLKASRTHLQDVIENTSKYTHALLEIILHPEDNSGMDMKSYQSLLGDYYVFMNQCHTEINHIDTLAVRLRELHQRLQDLQIEL